MPVLVNKANEENQNKNKVKQAFNTIAIKYKRRFERDNQDAYDQLENIEHYSLHQLINLLIEIILNAYLSEDEPIIEISDRKDASHVNDILYEIISEMLKNKQYLTINNISHKLFNKSLTDERLDSCMLFNYDPQHAPNYNDFSKRYQYNEDPEMMSLRRSRSHRRSHSRSRSRSRSAPRSKSRSAPRSVSRSVSRSKSRSPLYSRKSPKIYPRLSPVAQRAANIARLENPNRSPIGGYRI